MATTRKPCPACGVAPTFPYEAGSICPECKKLLKEAKEARGRRARKEDLELVRVPFASYALPILGAIWDKPRDEIQQSIYAMVELLGSRIEYSIFENKEAVNLVDYDRSEDATRSSPKYWLLPNGFAALVGRLYAGIREGGAYAYEKGLAEGRALLVGLATGEVSIDTFNEATVGKVANKRRRIKR